MASAASVTEPLPGSGRCKCCGHPAQAFGAIDAARTGVDGTGRVFPPSPETVSYLRCEACGFIFTTHFDALSRAEMAEQIYNDQYILADPDFSEQRPRYFAELLEKLFGGQRQALRILDYGGGRSRLSELLLAKGFAACDAFDPYFGNAAKPEGRYELVTAFEVAEHSGTPHETFADAMSCAGDRGLLLFSTLLQPAKVDIGWWYIAPRNGHVSIYTRRALSEIARRCGAHLISLSEGLHVFYRDRRSPIVQRLAQASSQAMLYGASQQGPGAVASMAWQLLCLGAGPRALDPRHLLRSLVHSGQGTVRPR